MSNLLVNIEVKLLIASLLLFLANLGVLALTVKLYTEFYKERVRDRQP